MTSLVLIQCEGGRPVNGALAALQAVQPLGSIVVLACGDGAERAARELGADAAGGARAHARAANPPRAETMAPLLIEQQSALAVHAYRCRGKRVDARRAAARRSVAGRDGAVGSREDHRRATVRAARARGRGVDDSAAAGVSACAHGPQQRVRSAAARRLGPPAPIERIVLPQTNERSATLRWSAVSSRATPSN